MSESSEELKRIAIALEEILRLVKLDQEATKKRWEYKPEEKDDEQKILQKVRASNGPDILAARALVRGPRTKLQATSLKLQATSRKLDKIKL